MAKTRSEFSLKIWSNVPKFILFSLSLFIYVTYMTIYVIKLLSETYDQATQDPGTSSAGLIGAMQKITHYSNRVAENITLENDSLSTMRKKGLIYLLVGHIFFVVYIISAVRTFRTAPGHIPEEWHTKTQEAVRNAIETEKRVLTNIHRSVQKRKHEMLLDAAKPEVKTAATTPNILCSTEDNLNEENESDFLLQNDRSGSITDIPDPKTWTRLSIDKNEVVLPPASKEENSRLQSLTEQFGKIDDYETELTPERIDQMAAMNVMKYGNKRFCVHCQKFKPERTHHCSQCGVCILRMDHHCPWVNKCIGFYNYKYFFNMVFWAGASVLFISITYVEALVDSFLDPKINWFVAYITMLSYVMTLLMASILSCFTLFHFWLACKGRTTLEFCEKRKRAPNLEGGGLTF